MRDENFEGSEDEATRILKSSATKRKGRGFSSANDRNGVMDVDQVYEKVDESSSMGIAQKSIEGWVIFVVGVHEEATEEDVHDKFSEFGNIKNFAMDLDHRTGFVKGYALVEYESYEEAKRAISEMNGSKLFETTVHCDFAFVKKPRN